MADNHAPTDTLTAATAIEAMIVRDFPGFRVTHGRTEDDGSLYLTVEAPWTAMHGAGFHIGGEGETIVVSDQMNTWPGTQRAEMRCADVEGVGRAMRSVLEGTPFPGNG